MATDDEWLSAPQAAKELGIRYSTLRRWVTEGTGPPFQRHGRLFRIRRQDLDRYVETHRVQPGDLAHLDLK